jgi:hypothetical protein
MKSNSARTFTAALLVLVLGVVLGVARHAHVARADDGGVGANSIVPVDDQMIRADELAPVQPVSPGDAAEAIPDTVFTTKVGRFHYDTRWERECNIGELRDCAGNLVVKIGSDTPNWEGWKDLDGRWVRGFGELAFLPSECGAWFNISDPADNLRIIYNEPCDDVTATPTAAGGGGSNTQLECTGSTTTATFRVRSGSDDAEWSSLQGLKTSNAILPMGGSFGYDPTVGLRFQGVTIPRNAKITSARIKVAPAASSAIAVDMEIFGDNVGSAPSWNGGHSPGNAPRTPHSSIWHISSKWTGSQTCRYVSSSSFPSALQDIVLRSDWSSGHAMSVILEWTGPFAEASQRPAWSLEGGCAPQLTVTWCPARVVSTTPGSTPGSNDGATATPKSNTGATATPASKTTATQTPTKLPRTATPGGVTETPVPTASFTPSANDPTSTMTPGTNVETDTPTPTPTVDPNAGTPTPTEVPNGCDNPYDLNDDGVIDVFDLDIVVAAFGSSPGSPNWNPDADVNGDLQVDLVDYLIVRENFGPSCPPKGSTPAP